MSEKAIEPVEQKSVLFYDDEITAVRLEDGQIMIPLRPICDALGVAWSPQRRRINRDPVLSDAMRSVTVTVTDLDSSSSRPRTSEMLCLPLDYLNGWMFGINASRVKEEIQERLIRYQRECYRALADAFQRGELTTDPDIAELIQSDSDAAEAYRMALAVVKLARHQLVMEATQRQHGAQITDISQRLEDVEAALSRPDAVVTEEQASQISQAVKTVAIALGKQTKKNEFGAVYGEMYRKFGVTSYKLVPASRFDECMRWLTEWHQSITGDSPF